MKKIKLLLALFVMVIFSINGFANEIKKKQVVKKQEGKENVVAVEGNEITACCTRTATGGVVDSPTFVSVTITKCYGGKTRNDAVAAACHNASLAAQRAVNALKDSTVTIHPKTEDGTK